jgi:hypothetical protein
MATSLSVLLLCHPAIGNWPYRSVSCETFRNSLGQVQASGEIKDQWPAEVRRTRWAKRIMPMQGAFSNPPGSVPSQL